MVTATSTSLPCQPIGLGVPLGNALLAGAWLWLCAPTVGWLTRTFTAPDSRTQGILLGCAAVLLLARGWGRFSLRALLFSEPRAHLPAAALLAPSAVGLVLKPLDSNIVASAFFALGTYGLIGLYLPGALWRRGLVGVLLALSLLPFGPHLDAFLGFPARVATARGVEVVLRALGFAAQSAEAILIFENGVASVDLPCSGVKSLWVGGIFFLALTGLERRALGLRWLLAGAGFLGALMLANFARVLLLVLIGFGLAQPKAAALVHLPLGVFGFVASSALALLFVRHLPPAVDAPVRLARPFRAGAVLLAMSLGALGLARPRAAREHPPPQPTAIQLPEGWTVSPLPMTPKEEELFGRHDARRVSKWRFHAGELEGALMVLVADSFRAHHAPEVCLAGAGHRIDEVRQEALAPGLPLKLVDIDHRAATGAYWFQSAHRTTDALLTRTLAELSGGERRWALVYVLFDRRTSLRDTTPVLLALHQAVGASLRAAKETKP